MAFELPLSAPFNFSVGISSKHLSMFWGNGDAGFYLAAEDHPTTGDKLVKTWRNPACNSLNVVAFGLQLVWNSGQSEVPSGEPVQ